MPLEESTKERLIGLLNRLVMRKDVAHAVAAIESGDGRFRWIDATGEADSDGTRMRTTRLSFSRASTRSSTPRIEYGLGIMRFRLPRIVTPLHPVLALVGHTGLDRFVGLSLAGTEPAAVRRG